MIQSMKLFGFVLAVCSLIGSLAFSEFLARAAIGYPQMVGLGGMLIELDPFRVHKLAPFGGPGINSSGFRDREFLPKEEGLARVIVLGDSMVMGANVKSEQTFPKQLEQLESERFEVFNLGTVGYGPDQSYQTLLTEGVNLNPDIVVLTIFPANDFQDLLNNRLVQLESEGPSIDPRFHALRQFTPESVLPMLVTQFRRRDFLTPEQAELINSILFADAARPLSLVSAPERQKAEALMVAVLRLFKRQAEMVGFRPIVLIIPNFQNIQDDEFYRILGVDPRDYFVNETTVQKICLELEVENVNLSESFLAHRSEGLFTIGDGHLSVVGNARAAAALQKQINSPG